MKRILVVVLLLACNNCFAQTDKNGNPIFHSVSISEEKIKDYLLVTSYYTLHNNLENKKSSVYVSDSPTVLEVEYAALNLMSEFFLVAKNHSLVALISISTAPNRHFQIVNPQNGSSKEYPYNLPGDISENRAKELIDRKYDPKARIEGAQLYFNNKKYNITANKKIKDAVIALIAQEHLNAPDSSDITFLSQDEIRSFLLTESKVGGRLDYFTEIKDHEYDGIQVKPGLFTTKLSMALYHWGYSCFEAGVNTLEDVYTIFSEFKARPLNQREKEYLQMGFENKLEL